MEWIKKTYIYVFSAVGLIMVLIGAARLINVGLRTYIFTEADTSYMYPMAADQKNGIDQEQIILAQEHNQRAARESDAAWGISLLIVGLPLFLYHFRLVKKESFHA